MDGRGWAYLGIFGSIWVYLGVSLGPTVERLTPCACSPEVRAALLVGKSAVVPGRVTATGHLQHTAHARPAHAEAKVRPERWTICTASCESLKSRFVAAFEGCQRETNRCA